MSMICYAGELLELVKNCEGKTGLFRPRGLNKNTLIEICATHEGVTVKLGENKTSLELDQAVKFEPDGTLKTVFFKTKSKDPLNQIITRLGLGDDLVTRKSHMSRIKLLEHEVLMQSSNNSKNIFTFQEANLFDGLNLEFENDTILILYSQVPTLDQYFDHQVWIPVVSRIIAFGKISCSTQHWLEKFLKPHKIKSFNMFRGNIRRQKQ